MAGVTLRSRPQSDRLRWPLTARQVEALDDMLEELYKSMRKSRGVLTLAADGDGVVTVDTTDPLRPVVGFGGVNTDASLTGDGTSASPLSAASAAWTTVFKAANTVRHNNTLAADPDLVVPLVANKAYTIRLVVHFSSTTAADIKYRHAGPASPTRVHCHRYTRGPDLASVYAMDEAYSAADVAIACLDGELAGFMQMDFSIVNGANAGDFAFWWAQNATQAPDDTIVYAGSYVEYRQLD